MPTGSHIKNLYEMDSKKKISCCRRLTKRHIEVRGQRAQVLSHSVAAALNMYISANALDSSAFETSEFIFRMDKLFDSVNARTLIHVKEEMCAVTEKSGHLKLWKEALPWIENWNIRSSTTGKDLHVPSKDGWLITLNAFIGISEVLLKKIKFILTSRFSQDALENTFSSVRRRGGFRDNPDAYEFRHTIQKVIITNFLKHTSGKNCEDDDASSLIDFSCFNKKELLEIISVEECAAGNVSATESPSSTASATNTESENFQQDGDSLVLNSLDSVEENVLCYISGYFAKKKLLLNGCLECQKLLVDADKILDNHKLLLYFKEYDMSKAGLKWPTENLFKYFMNLHELFSSNFDMFFQKHNISEKFNDALNKFDIKFFVDHPEHKEKA